MKQIQRLIDGVDNWQQRHHLPGFTYAVIKKYGEDGAGYQAALLTYYGFLSLFPLLLVLTTLSNSIAGHNADFERIITEGVTNYFPVLGYQLSSHIHALKGNGLALTVGLLFTLYGTRGVADVFQKGIQTIWGVQKPKLAGFPAELIKSLAIIIIGGLGFLAASIIAGFALAAGHGLVFRGLSIALNLSILFWLFTFLLNVSLPRHVSVKNSWVGAASAAIGLVILQAVGGYILARQLKGLDALYSYFALTLGLLFWIYLQAQMIYYSAEIAVVSSKKLWPRRFSEE